MIDRRIVGLAVEEIVYEDAEFIVDHEEDFYPVDEYEMLVVEGHRLYHVY